MHDHRYYDCHSTRPTLLARGLNGRPTKGGLNHEPVFACFERSDRITGTFLLLGNGPINDKFRGGVVAKILETSYRISQAASACQVDHIYENQGDLPTVPRQMSVVQEGAGNLSI